MINLIYPESRELFSGLLKEEKIKKYLASLKKHCPEAYRHSVRVGLLSIDLGHDSKLIAYELRLLGYAGLLHDIGKVKVPNDILSKQSPLSSSERDVLNRHAHTGFLAIGNAGYGRTRQIVAAHHEYQSLPYPRNRKEQRNLALCNGDRRANRKKISMLAQIVAVADIYDALASERAYKKPFSKEKIKGILLKQFTGDRKYISQVLKR